MLNGFRDGEIYRAEVALAMSDGVAHYIGAFSAIPDRFTGASSTTCGRFDNRLAFDGRDLPECQHWAGVRACYSYRFSGVIPEQPRINNREERDFHEASISIDRRDNLRQPARPMRPRSSRDYPDR